MQNHTENKVYAGFFVRFVAYAIDSFIIILALSTVSLPLSIAAASGADFLSENFIFHHSILEVFDYLAVAAYFILLTYFTHTTPGKAAMRLEVVVADKEWTIWNIIYRETVGRFFSSLLCIGYFAVFVSKKKQGFHDMLCDTYVVYKGMQPKLEQALAFAEAVPVNLGEENPNQEEDLGNSQLDRVLPESTDESPEEVLQSVEPVWSEELSQTDASSKPAVTVPVYHKEQ